MARSQDSERYELSDAEKRDLIKLINDGKLSHPPEPRTGIEKRKPHLRQSGPLYHRGQGDRYFWQ